MYNIYQNSQLINCFFLNEYSGDTIKPFFRTQLVLRGLATEDDINEALKEEPTRVLEEVPDPDEQPGDDNNDPPYPDGSSRPQDKDHNSSEDDDDDDDNGDHPTGGGERSLLNENQDRDHNNERQRQEKQDEEINPEDDPMYVDEQGDVDHNEPEDAQTSLISDAHFLEVK